MIPLRIVRLIQGDFAESPNWTPIAEVDKEQSKGFWHCCSKEWLDCGRGNPISVGNLPLEAVLNMPGSRIRISAQIESTLPHQLSESIAFQ